LSHSYAQNHIHLVFSTKNRERLISNKMQERLWPYMTGICKNHDMLPFAVGGMPDHVHVLFRLPPTLALARAITLIKSNSSKWMGEHGRYFAWQEGYGAFSVSSSSISSVIKYIDGQELHHRKRTYEEEFPALLKKHNHPFDPKDFLG